MPNCITKTRQVNLQRPSRLTPEHLAACLSSDSSDDTEKPQAECPQALAGKQDPEKSFLPDRRIREILTVLSMRDEVDLSLPSKRMAGLYLPAVKEMPKSRADFAPLWFFPMGVKDFQSNSISNLLRRGDTDTFV